MNTAERDLITSALALLLRAKKSMRYRSMGGRNGCHDELVEQMDTISGAEVALEGLLWPTAEELEVVG